jgi:hypothetical protein
MHKQDTAPRVPAYHPIHATLARMKRQGEEAGLYAFSWPTLSQKIIVRLDERNEYSLTDFAKLCDVDSASPDLITGAGFLCSCATPVMDIEFHFVEEELRYVLPPESRSALIREQAIPHPKTGETIKDAASKTYIIYRIRHDMQ